MWLAETAADTESLELPCATRHQVHALLAPHQCKRIRPLKDGGGWSDTAGATVDTTRPYLVRFDSGVSIAVFFYNGPVSRAIAFEGLLNFRRELCRAPQSRIQKTARKAQLVHVGHRRRVYGHHHKHGEMALAYTLRRLEETKTVNLANYGSFLEEFSPEYELRDCGQHFLELRTRDRALALELRLHGGKPGCNQLWRAPLRQALDELRDAVVPLTEQEGGKLFKDVWAARDGYIEVVLDRGEESVERFFPRA